MSNTAKGNMAEDIALLATIDPASIAASTVTTDIIDMRYWREVLFIVVTGALGTSATADFLVKGSAASNMGSPANLTTKAITQLVKASHDNTQSILRVTAEEVAAQGFRYIQGSLTIGTNASIATVIAIGSHARYSDAADFDLASVNEIVM